MVTSENPIPKSSIEFMEKFQKIEKDYQLFDIKNEDGIKYWDLVRHTIFGTLFIGESYTKNICVKPQSRSLLTHFRRLLNLFLNQVKLYYNLVVGTKYKTVLFKGSRFTINGKQLDKVSSNLESLMNPKTTFFIENSASIMDYHNISNRPFFIVFHNHRTQKKADYFCKNIKKSYKITEIIRREFKTDYDFDSLIHNTIIKYQCDKKFYLKMFKRFKTNQVYFVQGGIQKGLISACKLLNIKTYELQHGLISFDHPAYSYSKDLDYSGIDTIPDYLLTFSDFWNKQLYCPVKKAITIGNDCFYLEKIHSNTQTKLTIVCADIYYDEFRDLAIILVGKNTKLNILFKLHPNQASQYNGIKKDFAGYKNIEVVLNEKSINKIFEESFGIVVIQSSMAYEALQSGLKVYIYTKYNYDVLTAIFNKKNVFLFENAVDLLNKMEKHQDDTEQIDNVMYFDKFNKKLALEILNSNF